MGVHKCVYIHESTYMHVCICVHMSASLKVTRKENMLAIQHQEMNRKKAALSLIGLAPGGAGNVTPCQLPITKRPLIPREQVKYSRFGHSCNHATWDAAPWWSGVHIQTSGRHQRELGRSRNPRREVPH